MHPPIIKDLKMKATVSSGSFALIHIKETADVTINGCTLDITCNNDSELLYKFKLPSSSLFQLLSSIKIVLTLQNGNTIDIPVGDLINGLQTEITSNNKLASDLVDDTNQTNLFVTSQEKTAWNKECQCCKMRVRLSNFNALIEGYDFELTVTGEIIFKRFIGND